MQSLGDILRRIVKNRADRPEGYVPEPDESKPVCSICNGARFLGVPLVFDGGRHVEQEIVPCPCNPAPAPVNRWGHAVPLVAPVDMLPFGDIDPQPVVKGFTGDLRNAMKATIGWTHQGHGTPPFLVLNGIPGSGKTRLAKAACLQLWDIHPVLFITEPAMISMLHKSLDTKTLEPVMEELQTIPNLILDDYGLAALTPGTWAHGKRDEILSARWENSLRTLITTNLKGADILADSPRLGSRMMDKTRAVNVAIQAADYRQKER